ncbi:uncharacterized protein LOC143915277 [Arctopsyche grandis]|uniref:uncharacterized protein LOC143915277 n=1 Tax=Arctopsyche grandis TaxID=121162 RepID=UPI00406D6F66
MELIRIIGISSVSIILIIVSNVSAKAAIPPTIKPNMEFINEIKTNLYNGYSTCKEELGLPGANFSEFKKEIIADKVDGNTVGCALTCMATKANYVKENRIDETKLKNDINTIFNVEHPFIASLKTKIDECISKANTQFSDESCKLIKGLFGCVMTEFKDGALGKLIVATSADRKILYRKFTEV